jgi:polar amino acid transport system substrate-binding protein
MGQKIGLGYRTAAVTVLAVVLGGSLAACGSSSTKSTTAATKASATAADPSSSTTAAAASAATGVDAAARALLPADIKASNKVTVASSIGFAPYELYGPDGKTPEGLDIDLVHDIAPILGVTFKINDVRYPDIVPALQAKRYDVAWSAFGEYPTAEQVVDFATYLDASASGAVLVKSSAPVKAATDLCGKSVGVVGGEPADTINAVDALCKKAGKPALSQKMFQKTADIVLALESGQLYARLSDTANGGYIAAHSNGALKLVKNILPPVSGPVGVAAIKGPEGDALINAIAKALQVLVENGKYKAVLAKWFAADAAIKTITTTVKS